MDFRNKLLKFATCLLLVIGTGTTRASAQTDPLGPQKFNWIHIETSTSSPGADQPLTIGRLRGSYRVTDLLSVRIDLPFSDAGQGFPFNGQNVGNVYAGILLNSKRDNVFSELGIRFPTAGSSGSDPLVFRATAPEFGEAFLDNVTAVSGNINYVAMATGGVFLKLRSGIAVWLDDLGQVGSETLFNYSAEAGVSKQAFRADARIQGRALISGGNGSLADRTFHQFRLSAGKRMGSITPAATLTVPLGEFNNGVDYVLGLGIGVRFGNRESRSRRP